MPYWPRLGLTGFVIAEVVALYMVFTIFVSDSHRDGR